MLIRGGQCFVLHELFESGLTPHFPTVSRGCDVYDSRCVKSNFERCEGSQCLLDHIKNAELKSPRTMALVMLGARYDRLSGIR